MLINVSKRMILKFSHSFKEYPEFETEYIFDLVPTSPSDTNIDLIDRLEIIHHFPEDMLDEDNKLISNARTKDFSFTPGYTLQKDDYKFLMSFEYGATDINQDEEWILNKV